MVKYTLQRLLLMLMVTLIITLICFVLIRMLPPAELAPNDPHADIIAARREALGYNKPYLEQFWIFLKNVVLRWDWGVSDVLYSGRDVNQIFAEKIPATVYVNFISVIVSIPIGIIFGIIAALKKNTWLDYTISTLTIVCISVPAFVYAFLIQYFICFKLGWFPLLMSPGTDYFTWSMFVSVIPPVLSLSLPQIAGYTRTTRAELGEVLTGDYMLLARTKGLTKTQATVRHAMKNCMVIIVPSIFGSIVGTLYGGMITERIFAIPGVGSLSINAINARDYPLFLFSSCFYTVIGLASSIVVDISYGFIDPRIRMGSKK